MQLLVSKVSHNSIIWKRKGVYTKHFYNRYPFRCGVTQFAAPIYYKEMTSGPELFTGKDLFRNSKCRLHSPFISNFSRLFVSACTSITSLPGIPLTHWGRVTHICISNLIIIVSNNGWSAPSHYLKQCWIIVNWTPRNKLQWNFNRYSYIFIQGNAS